MEEEIPPKPRQLHILMVEQAPLQFRLALLPGYGALDKAIGVGLRCVDLRVFACVLEAIVPAHVYLVKSISLSVQVLVLLGRG